MLFHEFGRLLRTQKLFLMTSMPPTLNQSPIVIHAQWRTGSTYLYHVFRRLGPTYFCYYEPVHELVVKSVIDKDSLLAFGHADTDALRHPRLTNTYLYEMWQTFDSWKGNPPIFKHG